MPLRPGLIINNPQRRLPEEQRRIFADNGWEIVDAAPPAPDTTSAVLFQRLVVDERSHHRP